MYFLKCYVFLFFLFLSVLFLNGCYLMKQGTYIVRYNKSARDIDKLLKSKEIDEDLKETFALVQEIKLYAVQAIGLKEDRNYTKYVELERDYLVDVISASEKDSFTPYIWSYCFFGSFPYKGFFEREDAEREAEELKKKGLDVLIRKVDAFSTLGFFVDPVYSFMAGYSVFALASLIIHEQTHTTLFLKNQVQFNEELAGFVGIEGALNFIRAKYGEDSEFYRQALDNREDWDRYSSLIKALYEELRRLYEGGWSREYKLTQREIVFESFKERFRTVYSGQFKTESFRKLGEIPLNNAYILSFTRYTQDLELFYRLYRARGYDLKKTVQILKKAKDAGGDPKAFLRKMIESDE